MRGDEAGASGAVRRTLSNMKGAVAVEFV